jgi:hypothetical protein
VRDGKEEIQQREGRRRNETAVAKHRLNGEPYKQTRRCCDVTNSSLLTESCKTKKKAENALVYSSIARGGRARGGADIPRRLPDLIFSYQAKQLDAAIYLASKDGRRKN